MYIYMCISTNLLSVPDAARASLAMSGKLKVRKMYEAVEENHLQTTLQGSWWGEGQFSSAAFRVDFLLYELVMKSGLQEVTGLQSKPL